MASKVSVRGDLRLTAKGANELLAGLGGLIGGGLPVVQALLKLAPAPDLAALPELLRARPDKALRAALREPGTLELVDPQPWSLPVGIKLYTTRGGWWPERRTEVVEQVPRGAERVEDPDSTHELHAHRLKVWIRRLETSPPFSTGFALPSRPGAFACPTTPVIGRGSSSGGSNGTSWKSCASSPKRTGTTGDASQDRPWEIIWTFTTPLLEHDEEILWIRLVERDGVLVVSFHRG